MLYYSLQGEEGFPLESSIQGYMMNGMVIFMPFNFCFNFNNIFQAIKPLGYTNLIRVLWIFFSLLSCYLSKLQLLQI